MRYFKQAWQILKQNRFYSTIYILATGISISMVMVLAIVIYIKIANVYPETGRDRMLIVNFAQTTVNDGNNGQSRLSFETVRQCIYPLKSAEAVSAVYGMWGGNSVQPDDSPEHIPAIVKHVDTGFWKVFSFSFTGGGPFTEEDMESGMRTVVICESFARQIYGTTDVVGKFINLNFDPYRICGVVKDVSYVADKTFAQIWMPFTAYPGFTPMWENDRYNNTLGTFTAYVLSPSLKDINKVKEEIRANVSRYNSSLGDNMTFTIYNQPDRQWQAIFRNSRSFNLNYSKIIIQYAFLFLLFLLIPAVSLSGMADSQMERRLSEMGIRRAFGAPSGNLMKQLVAENLLFTVLGGLAGLFFSYGIVYFFRRWIIHIGTGQKFVSAVPQGLDVAITPDMLMNYIVFGIALLICLILNLMVTVIPAWRASRREIVYSLNH